MINKEITLYIFCELEKKNKYELDKKKEGEFLKIT